MKHSKDEQVEDKTHDSETSMGNKSVDTAAVVKNPNNPELTEEEGETAGGGSSKRPVTRITNTYTETVKIIAFKHVVKDPGDPRRKDTQSEEEFMFTIPAQDGPFVIEIDDSEQVPFSYDFTKGMLSASGQKILSGKISGQKNEDGTWDIHVDLQVEMKDVHSLKIYTKNVLFRQPFSKLQ